MVFTGRVSVNRDFMANFNGQSDLVPALDRGLSASYSIIKAAPPPFDLSVWSFCIFCENRIKIYGNRKFALVGIIPNQLFSFSSDKDRRTDSRIRWKKHSAAPPGIEPRILRNLVARSIPGGAALCFFRLIRPVSSSIFVGAKREELIYGNVVQMCHRSCSLV